jgi:hypothetical protein
VIENFGPDRPATGRPSPHDSLAPSDPIKPPAPPIAVPEPGSGWMLIVAGGMAGLRRAFLKSHGIHRRSNAHG